MLYDQIGLDRKCEEQLNFFLYYYTTIADIQKNFNHDLKFDIQSILIMYN